LSVALIWHVILHSKGCQDERELMDEF